MKATIAIAIAALLSPTALFAADKLLVKGSDTLGAKMLPRLAEAYKAAGNDVSFEIEDKGSSSAFTNLLAGTAEIGMSSRMVKDEEVDKFTAKGQELIEHVAAVDMIAVILNEKNGVSDLTVRQIEGIFTGDITDWSEVGGKPGPISVYTRNEQSGTYKSFQKLAMDGRDYGDSTQKMEGNEQIATEVAGNDKGIGYVGLAYAAKDGVKSAVVDGVEASPDFKEDYPLARNLFYYTIGQPTGAAGAFLTWAISAEAAPIVSDVGFIPAN